MRKLRIILICIAGLIITGLAIFQWRKVSANKTPIHKDADIVIDINADGLLQTLAWNALLHPGYYIKQGGTGADSVQINKGFAIPAHFFIYSVSGDTSHSFYLTLKVKDQKDLINYVAAKFDIKTSPVPGTATVSGSNSSGNIAFVCNKDWAVAGWSPGSIPSQQIMADVLENKQTVEAGHHALVHKNTSGSHLTWLTKDGFAALTFESGCITISGNWPVATDKQAYRQLVSDTQTPLQFSTNNSFTSLLKNRQYTLKGCTINGDSLLHYYKGFTGFIMQDSVMQADTVITYGYNDNFETVPQKTIAEKSVPGLTLLLDADAGGLYHYLSRCGVINTDSSFNRELFPLYRLYAHVHNQQFYISTGNNNVPGTSNNPDAPYFNMTVNTKTLKSYSNYSALNNYLNLVTGLNLQVSGQGKKGTINGSVDFYNKDINAFMLLANN